MNKQDKWSAGKTLPGDYLIIRQIGQGGMGTVYLTEKQSWREDVTYQYALKIIRDRAIGSEKRHHAFLRELRNWIDLPKHPNLTQCHYFKTIHDKTAIFAEYVDGGSLRQWVKTLMRRGPLDIRW